MTKTTKTNRLDQYMPHKPVFLITIDTEGDHLWSRPDPITTENSKYLPRFQELCERYGCKPTWLTNYEMAESPIFYEFGSDVLQRDAGEIGMHLHAWNSPPVIDYNPMNHAYLIEYPKAMMRDKIQFLTELLEQRFQRKMVSHRAGRWAFNSCYAHLLVEHGYLVDCSVTPHVSWTHVPGDPNGSGGTDYTTYPTQPYFLNLDRIDRDGPSPLLEIPVSIVAKLAGVHRVARYAPRLVRRAVARHFPFRTRWLRPNGENLNSMLTILHQAVEDQWPCVEFSLHSSELMPGGSPTFGTPASIEKLYDDLEALLSHAATRLEGATLSEFYATWVRSHRPGSKSATSYQRQNQSASETTVRPPQLQNS